MGPQSYEAKTRYQDERVADNYDKRRFTGLKGKWTDQLEKKRVRQALAYAIVSGPVLDVPCGTGRMTQMLLDLGYSVTAGDISEIMMKHARERLKNYPKDVEFVTCDIENLQFPDGAFDLILTLRLLHHIPPALHPKIFAQFHRVTRRWVILTFSNKFTLQSVRRDLNSLVTKFPRYSVSPKLFRKEVELAGFEIKKYLPLMPIVSESVTVLLEKR